MPKTDKKRAASELPSLFVSFWDISLQNLPEGILAHHRITPVRAKSLIAQARRENRLLCVSQDDLLAPYRKRQLENHEQLCRALKDRFGISLSLKDFCTSDEIAADGAYTINPLCIVQLQGTDQLLVVSCTYTLAGGEKSKDDVLKIEPATVTFHLIEARPERR